MCLYLKYCYCISYILHLQKLSFCMSNIGFYSFNLYGIVKVYNDLYKLTQTFISNSKSFQSLSQLVIICEKGSMPVAYRAKLIYLGYVWREDIISTLLECVAKGAEGGRDANGVKELLWELLQPLIGPRGRLDFARRHCYEWYISEDRRRYSLHIYVPGWVNMCVNVELKEAEGLRACAGVIVARLLTSPEEVEALNIPSPLAEEVKDWIIWMNDTNNIQFSSRHLSINCQL